MAEVEITPGGWLAAQLEREGRHDVVDAGKAILDDAELENTIARSVIPFPNFSPSERHDWAAFHILTRNYIPAPQREGMNQEAAVGIQRIAQAQEGTARDFRALRGAFDAQNEKIEAVGSEVASAVSAGAASVVSAIDESNKQGSQRDLAIAEGLGQVSTAVNQARLSAELRDASRVIHWRVERRWLWVWRIAILLALLALCALRGHAQAPEGVTKKVQKLEQQIKKEEAKETGTQTAVTVIPLDDASKVKILELIRKQDALIEKKQAAQLQIEAMDKELSAVQDQINQSAQKMAVDQKIDTSTSVLDLDDLAWETPKGAKK